MRPLIVLSVAAVLFASGSRAEAQTSAASVWDGVYTDQQAGRGEELFRRRCTYCHGIDLAGSEDPNGPALKGPRFVTRWRGKSVADLFYKIADTMPANDPGVLSADSCSELIAYILKANGVPPGTSLLSSNPEHLEQVRISRDP